MPFESLSVYCVFANSAAFGFSVAIVCPPTFTTVTAPGITGPTGFAAVPLRRVTVLVVAPVTVSLSSVTMLALRPTPVAPASGLVAVGGATTTVGAVPSVVNDQVVVTIGVPVAAFRTAVAPPVRVTV
jgi:hypothetical protein